MANLTFWDANSTCPSEMVYGELRAATTSGTVPFSSAPLAGVLLPCFLIPVSLVLLTVGRRVVRTSFGALGLVAGGALALHVTYSTAALAALPCEAVVGGTLVIGFVCALLAGCVLRLAAFALGGACGVVTTIGVFALAPALATSVPLTLPVFLGYPLLPFWPVVAVMALLAGALAARYRSLTALSITSVLGGYLLALGVRIATRGATSAVVHMVLFVGFAALGLAFQVFLERRARARKRRVLIGGSQPPVLQKNGAP